MIEDIFSMLLAIAGTVCVIILTYYASRWYARRMGSIAGGKYIRIVDRLMVSKTGSILVIDVDGAQYMVGVNDQSIQIMKQLDKPIDFRMAEETTKERSIGAFRSLIHKEKKE